MNADELLQKIIAAGADEKGIQDRFAGNVALYERCFREFVEEPSFVALRDAVHTQNWEEAFSAAHALKGLSGNLGLSAFYDAIRVLLESLRGKRYASVEAEYAAVERQHEALKQILFPSPDAEPPAAPPLPERKLTASEELMRRLRRKDSRLLWLLLALSAAIIFGVSFLFCRINIIHRDNVVEESSQHLAEMTNQICRYIEQHIDIDWKTAQSVGDSISDGVYVADEDIFEMLRRKREVWGVSDLMLYTESGYCIYADGDTEMNDVASDTIYSARRYGKYMSVIGSKIVYTVPLSTQRLYAGSRLAAVSVVRDMATFLDDMEFSSFDKNAWMYLTDENGILISSLSNPAVKPVFNIQAAVAGMEITPLNEDDSPQDFLADPEVAAFLLSGDGGENYGVSAPVATGAQTLHLFYLVPESAVNSTMNGFSRQLILFSAVIIIAFAVCAFAASLYAYKSRKRIFDKAIMMRERMFDLLVKNTKTAFGLFAVNQETPDYISDNVAEVIGDRYWTLDKTDAGYHLHNDRHIETDNIARINELLRQWDGMSVLRSGYLHNGQSLSAPYFEFELYPVGEDGENFVGIAQDVTQAHAREDATREAMEMATRSNEAKTRFLSNMSHDIRTPMNAIMNMTNFALESIDQPKKLAPYLHVIHESAEHLLHLINDVLDMSRIESGQTVVASAPFDIKAEILRQVDMVRPLCQSKRQTLMVDCTGLRTASVCGDALKVSQVIMNLLSNAVKFTPEKGAVRLIATELPALRDGLVSVRFTVEDNGIGIPEADRKRIFEPFGRANDKKVSRIEGTGLGLSICKHYVEAMGGTIRCDSEQGEGSIFTVELFFQKSTGSAGQSESAAPLGVNSFLGMRCLVAEDNATNQLIAKELLERIGFLMDFADDGGEAVRKFTASKPGTYDVIYMDIQMPVLDGYQATVKIRASAHPQAKTVPIIAMTANAFAEDIEKARMVGMDAYVDKPVVSFNLSEQTLLAMQRKRGAPQ